MPNFPNYFMFLGMSAILVPWYPCDSFDTNCGAQGQTRQVDMRLSSSTRKCRYGLGLGPSPELVSSYGSLRERLSDPPHDAIDQTYHHGRGAVVCSPRGGQLKVQLVGAETASPDSVELLPLVLSP